MLPKFQINPAKGDERTRGGGSFSVPAAPDLWNMARCLNCASEEQQAVQQWRVKRAFSINLSLPYRIYAAAPHLCRHVGGKASPVVWEKAVKQTRPAVFAFGSTPRTLVQDAGSDGWMNLNNDAAADETRSHWTHTHARTHTGAGCGKRRRLLRSLNLGNWSFSAFYSNWVLHGRALSD